MQQPCPLRQTNFTINVLLKNGHSLRGTSNPSSPITPGITNAFAALIILLTLFIHSA